MSGDESYKSPISDIKRDYLVEALEDEMMTEEDFETIFDLLDIIALSYSTRFA